MQILRNLYQTPAYQHWQTWQRFWMLFHLLGRIADLEQLIVWARCKRLSGPRDYYRRLWLAESERWGNYSIHHARLSRWAQVLYKMNAVVRPQPAYRRKGSAAHYRRR